MKTVPPSGKATVDALADRWGKLFSIYMGKMGVDHVIITAKDIEGIGRADTLEKCLVVQELVDGLHIRLLPVAEAEALARKSKSGFGKS